MRPLALCTYTCPPRRNIEKWELWRAFKRYVSVKLINSNYAYTKRHSYMQNVSIYAVDAFLLAVILYNVTVSLALCFASNFHCHECTNLNTFPYILRLQKCNIYYNQMFIGPTVLIISKNDINHNNFLVWLACSFYFIGFICATSHQIEQIVAIKCTLDMVQMISFLSLFTMCGRCFHIHFGQFYLFGTRSNRIQ